MSKRKPVLMCVVCGELPGIFTPSQSIPPQWCLRCSIALHARFVEGGALNHGN